ncbi:hypothetical protein CYMTET_45530 [Cymbomonas tetramitiformis]|uniref:VWFA domain-containing protein n=1 Tax=Cymbomonas tetramitiformis TaxID=36881 RepID=A0AAE0BZV1_9CHLO|nr:hypothetical protein CYMTET_45530 [Cymbomonas tetramitiformis]
MCTAMRSARFALMFCALLAPAALGGEVGISLGADIQSPNDICDTSIDLMLVVDGSASITHFSWKEAVSFCDQLINSFTISGNASHVGLTQFSERAKLELSLSGDKASISSAIDYLRNHQMMENTAIGAGIKTGEADIEQLGRSGVPHIMILITDGQNNQWPSPSGPSSKAKNEGTEIFVVGVGSGVDRRELESIASQPTAKHVYYASDFKDLKNLIADITHVTCNTYKCDQGSHSCSILPPGSTGGMSKGDCLKQCVPPALSPRTFCVKGTGKASQDLKTCEAGCVNHVPPELQGVWRGLKIDHSFGGGEWDAEFTNTSLVLKGPSGPKQTFSVHTDADGNIQIVSSAGVMQADFKVEAEGIIAVATIAIGPVGGKKITSFDSAMTTTGYAVYSMAKCQEKGTDCDFSSSDPKSTLSSTLSAFSEAILVRGAPLSAWKSPKSEWTHFVRSAVPLCETPAEVMMVIDGSSSESSGNFSKILDFANELSKSFNVSASMVHIGVVQFSSKGLAKVVIPLSDDPAAISSAISGMAQSGGDTAIGDGIRMAEAEINKGRKTVKHVMILMTDGAENQGTNPLDASYDAKAEGTEIIILGVGDHVHLQALDAYASMPSSTHVYNPADFDSLKNFVDATVQTACNKYFKCDNASKTCQPTGPGEKGMPVAQCLANCSKGPKPPTPTPPTPPAAVFVCNQSTFTCDPAKPGSPGASSKETCSKQCSHNTPPALIGQWRGIQISPGYTPGEFDLNIMNTSYAFKDASGAVSKGVIFGTGYFSMRLDDAASGKSQAALFSYDSLGPEVTSVTMVIGKPGVVNLPLTVQSGFDDPNYITYMFEKCDNSAPTCDFSKAMP